MTEQEYKELQERIAKDSVQMGEIKKVSTADAVSDVLGTGNNKTAVRVPVNLLRSVGKAGLMTDFDAMMSEIKGLSVGQLGLWALNRGSEGRGVFSVEECELLFGKSEQMGFSVGDLLLVFKVTDEGWVASRIALWDVKAADGDFPGAEGLASAWDKEQINAAAAFMKSRNWSWDLNVAAQRADRGLFGHVEGNYNMNEQSEAGGYATGVLGRPAGAADGEEFFFWNSPKRKYDNGYSDFLQFAVSKSDPTRIWVRQVSWNDETNSYSTVLNDWSLVGGDDAALNGVKADVATLSGRMDSAERDIANVGVLLETLNESVAKKADMAGIEALSQHIENTAEAMAEAMEGKADKADVEALPTITTLTQAEYDALESKDENTLYLIKEE